MKRVLDIEDHPDIVVQARDKVGGTVLGLAIRRHLIDSMQGRAAVESQLGQGSTLTIYLPKI